MTAIAATPEPLTAPIADPPLWQPVLLGAMAGAMGWGIRGQYGHETGAMIAGVLVAFVLTLLFCSRANSLAAARAVAWCTIAIGFGGSETYGQTIGLTKDAYVLGNWHALLWGMLGLAIKGAVWIGFAGAFFGMALGGTRYRSREMLFVMAGLLLLHTLGVWALNSPFDPAQRLLPPIYFSADWRWNPEADLKPRPEVWGGLAFALAGLLAYACWARRDGLAVRMGLWGALGGAIGFPLGECLQAFPAWNPELFQSGLGAAIARHANWWNFMETTFGGVMGAGLGLGLWRNRRRIALPVSEPPSSLPGQSEAELLLLHVALLVAAEFVSPTFSWYIQSGYVLGTIPIVAVIGGRWWPYLLVFPVTALPIAGKTLRNLGYEHQVVPLTAAWLLYVVIPLGLARCMAWLYAPRRAEPAHRFLADGLLFCTWLYFGLNFAFFRFPWPWQDWTNRTPNALVFTVCALGLTWLALSRRGTSGTQGPGGHRP